MAELKTKKTDADVGAFLGTIEDAAKRRDATTLVDLFQRVTKEPAKLWGSGIVGFGDWSYPAPGGKTRDWMLTGFSPRAQNLAIYLMGGVESVAPLLDKLGPHKTGKGCLYISKLADVDLQVLERVLRRGIAATHALHKASKDVPTKTKAKAPAKRAQAKAPAKRPAKGAQ